MSIEKMQLVNIAGLVKDLDAVLIRCSDSGCFHIESAGKIAGAGQGFSSLREDNPYLLPLKQLTELAAANGIELVTEEGTDYTEDSVIAMTAYIRQTTICRTAALT